MVEAPDMTEPVSELDTLRQQIDALDTRLHDTMMQRMSLIGDIARAKNLSGGSSAMRPAREAMVLRRIVARHASDMEAAIVVRMWREMMNAATAMQGPLSVAVCAPEKSVGYWDLARNHFGSATPMTLHRSPKTTLRRVTEDRGTLGLLPVPADAESEPWWPGLTVPGSEEATPRVLWRLPFVHCGQGQFEDLEAIVVGCLRPAPSGADRTLVAVEVRQDISRARLIEIFKDNDLIVHFIATHGDQFAEWRYHLIEVDGFADEEDGRFNGCLDKLGDPLHRLAVLGSYPVPIAG